MLVVLIGININTTIRKLLVSINKSLSGYLIGAKHMSNTLFTNFLTEFKKQKDI